MSHILTKNVRKIMARLPIHSVETAPEAAKERVQSVLKANGFIPNLIGVLANSPEALAFYQEVGKLNAQTTLTAGEREIVQILAAKSNQCGFCVAGHTKLATLKKILPENAIAAARALNPAQFDDKKLCALAEFTLAILAHKGMVSDEQLNTFLAAGYTLQQSLEVVLGVALATLCNYSNNLAKTEINPELQAFA